MVSKMSGDIEIREINIGEANPASDEVIKSQTETGSNTTVQNEESAHLNGNVADGPSTVQIVDQEKGMSKSPFLNTFVVTELVDRKPAKGEAQSLPTESASQKILNEMFNDPVMGPIIAKILLPSPAHSQNSGSEVSVEEFVASQKGASISQSSQIAPTSSEDEEEEEEEASESSCDDADVESSEGYYSSEYYSEEEDYECTYSSSLSSQEVMSDHSTTQDKV